MRVRATFSSAPGTLVTDAEGVAAAGVSRVATAVSHVDHMARFSVSLPPDDPHGGHMDAQIEVFRRMAAADISLDMFTPCADLLVFSTSEMDVAKTVAVLDDIALPYRIDQTVAKVTLVGTGMHGVPGVMARVAEALGAAGITVLQVSDSHATISVLVWQNRRSRAVAALHDAFDLGADD
jgi:aspartate kinase